MPPGKPLSFDPIAEARRQWEGHGWGEAAAMTAATSIMRAQQLVQREVDAALAPLGLTFARYEVLALLSFSRAGALPLGKVGERLMVHPASVTNAVDRLEAQALVERRSHPSDRRRVLAAITERGRAVTSEATTALTAVRFGLGSLSSAQCEELFGLIRHLRLGVDDFDDA